MALGIKHYSFFLKKEYFKYLEQIHNYFLMKLA